MGSISIVTAAESSTAIVRCCGTSGATTRCRGTTPAGAVPVVRVGMSGATATSGDAVIEGLTSVSGPRVGLLERRAQALRRDVGVALGRGERRVPQDLLDRAQVGPALDEVRGGAVAERVRRDVVDAGEGGDGVRGGPQLTLVDAVPAA